MKIAIIGGGFSGFSLSAKLILKGTPPLSIYLCEKENQLGQGIAYSTPFSWHLLNVPTDSMGLLEKDPEGFYKWLIKHETSWRKTDPYYKTLAIHEESFLPRKLYGLYLSAMLEELRMIAKDKGIDFVTIHNTVVDIEPISETDLRVIFQDQNLLDVDKAVLATGVAPIKKLSLGPPAIRYIENLWNCNKHMMIELISGTNRDSVIFIIGTSLTMVDMITTLDKLNYPGKIIALSRHGRLPASHLPKKPTPSGNIENIFNGNGLIDKYHSFKEELLSVANAGGDWRQLVTALRPHTTQLWQELSQKDKKRFLRHLTPLWNRHRHRLAPESGEIIAKFVDENRLEILKGKMISINENEMLDVQYKTNNTIHTIKADYVFNCTGPEYSLKKISEPLLKNLLKRGMIQGDDLDLGIKSNFNFQAVGPQSDNLYVMGSLLFGDRFETTAAAEIRLQAKIIASELVSP